MESSGLCGMHFTKERGEEGGNPIHFRLPARWVLFHEFMSWLCLGRDTVERVQQTLLPVHPILRAWSQWVLLDHHGCRPAWGRVYAGPLLLFSSLALRPS